jgi:hypothetical protein
MEACAISPENRDPLFGITLKTLDFLLGASSTQKGSPAKGPGKPLLRRNIVRNR